MADERPPLSNPMAEALAEDAAIAAAKAARENPQPAPLPEPVAAAPEAVTDAVAAEPEAPAAPTEAEKQKQANESALMRRLSKLTAEKKRAEDELAAAKRLLEAAKTPNSDGDSPSPPAGARTYTQAELDAAANDIANRRAFNERANQTYEAGKEKYGDFEPRMQALRETGLMSEALLEGAMASNAPADVLHHLAGNLAEAERIASLPPIRMGVEMATLAGKLGAPKTARVSGAPAPINPIVGTASPAVDFAKLADSDDMNAYVAARAKAGDKWATGRR